MQQFQFPRWNTGSIQGASVGCVRGSFGPVQAKLFLCV